MRFMTMSRASPVTRETTVQTAMSLAEEKMRAEWDIEADYIDGRTALKAPHVSTAGEWPMIPASPTGSPCEKHAMHFAVVLLKYLCALPTTLVGLLLIPPTLLSGGGVQCVSGVAEVYGGFVACLLRRCVPLPGGATALTLGHVVLGVDRIGLDLSRDHERVHVRQCERWGPFFIPAYLFASLWAFLRKRDAYRDNVFEREAYGDASV
jgi:hypothetical protein